jgi:HSP20 family molecular chaperone IbpA
VRTVGFLFLVTIFSVTVACASSQNSTVNNNNSNTQNSAENNSNSNPEAHDFTISADTQPTLIVNNDVGSVHVQPGSSLNNVHVKVTKSGGNPDDIQVEYSQNGNTVTVTIKRTKTNSTAKADADITVPNKSELQLHNGTGDIAVTGIEGKMSLTDGTGSINATQATLSSNSQLQTSTGSVNFSGSIGSGSYQFQSSTGDVEVSLPANASFHANANTNVGSISSDFPDVAIQRNIVGASASGSSGSTPAATITLTTNTGSIYLQKQMNYPAAS